MRAILTLTLLLFAGPTLAQERFVGSNVDLRTTLSFKASEAAVQKLLPEGWEINSPAAGPSKGANVTVTLLEQVVSYGADGKPVETFRGAVFSIPAKRKGTDSTGGMVFGGLFDPVGTPGAYGVYSLAQTTIDRKAQTGADKKLTKEEHWQLKADGELLEVQIQYAPGVPTTSKINPNVHSAAKPDFYRIYRIEQAVEGQLFDGTEQLISVISVPWYTRQLYLPGS